MFDSKHLIAGVALTSLLAGVACGGAQKPETKGQMDENQMGPNLAGPRDGVYLRASFDDDPSHFIGRFLSDDMAVTAVDENRGVQTECSQFVTYKEVRAAGSFDEYYNSSTSVAGSLGIDPTAGQGDVVQAATGQATPKGEAAFGHEDGTAIRVKYDLTKKLVAHVEDPAAFEACCDAAPGNCTGTYIGEFWMGTGELFERTGRSTGGSASVEAPQGQGAIEVADGWTWRRATKFDEVYFAFRTTDRVATDTCTWVDQLPKSADGQYFVGISPPSPTEDIARTAAMKHARTQVVKYMGEVIQSQSTTTSGVIDGYVEDENVVTTAAEGLASLVKDDRYCSAEQIETPEGVKFKVKVLAFFPREKEQQAAEQTVTAVEQKMQAEGKLDSKAKKELGDLRAKLAAGVR